MQVVLLYIICLVFLLIFLASLVGEVGSAVCAEVGGVGASFIEI